MTSSPDLSIIVPNYNGATLLEPCLTSVAAASTGLSTELWIVDNHSTDSSVEMVQTRFPAAQLIANAENRGFAAAINQALRVYRGRYALLLNNDTVVQPDALRVLLTTAEAMPRLAGLGSQLLNRDGTVQPSCMHFPSLRRSAQNYAKARLGRSGKYAPDQGSDPVVVDAVTGACLLLRRAAVTEVGLLDEGYFMYGEETDWCFRAWRAGWQIGYAPAAKVIHLGGQTASRESDRFYVERRVSNVRFYLKHRGRTAAKVNAALIRANLLLRAAAAPRRRARYAEILRLYNSRVTELFR